jgi:predicted nucleic acid-binding protein
VKWLKAQPATTLFLSVVTIGEIRRGLTVLPPGRRRSELETWFQTDLLMWFRNRILPVTHVIADRWGELDGQPAEGNAPEYGRWHDCRQGIEHDLTVVTRNVKDFAGLGVGIFNPWEM